MMRVEKPEGSEDDWKRKEIEQVIPSLKKDLEDPSWKEDRDWILEQIKIAEVRLAEYNKLHEDE